MACWTRTVHDDELLLTQPSFPNERLVPWHRLHRSYVQRCLLSVRTVFTLPPPRTGAKRVRWRGRHPNSECPIPAPICGVCRLPPRLRLHATHGPHCSCLRMVFGLSLSRVGVKRSPILLPHVWRRVDEQVERDSANRNAVPDASGNAGRLGRTVCERRTGGPFTLQGKGTSSRHAEGANPRKPD